MRDALAAGRTIDRLCVPLAAWMRFVRRAALRGEALNDPLAARLLDIGRACTGQGSQDVPRFLSLESMFPADLRDDPRLARSLTRAYDQYDMRSSQDNAS
jgi:fructuronate reductase